jgi:hypothetical protein
MRRLAPVSSAPEVPMKALPQISRFSHANCIYILNIFLRDSSFDVVNLATLWWKLLHLKDKDNELHRTVAADKIMVAQLVKTFPVWYVTWKSIPVPAWARHWSLSWARWIQFTRFHYNPFTPER